MVGTHAEVSRIAGGLSNPPNISAVSGPNMGPKSEKQATQLTKIPCPTVQANKCTVDARQTDGRTLKCYRLFLAAALAAAVCNQYDTKCQYLCTTEQSRHVLMGNYLP